MIPNTGFTEEEFNKILDAQIERKYNNLDYKIVNNRVVGYVDDIDALLQAIFFILSTERYKYVSMSGNTGVELEELYGESGDLIELKLISTIREALLNDDRITNINYIDLKHSGRNTYTVEVEVDSIFGEIKHEEEVTMA